MGRSGDERIVSVNQGKILSSVTVHSNNARRSFDSFVELFSEVTILVFEVMVLTFIFPWKIVVAVIAGLWVAVSVVRVLGYFWKDNG